MVCFFNNVTPSLITLQSGRFRYESDQSVMNPPNLLGSCQTDNSYWEGIGVLLVSSTAIKTKFGCTLFTDLIFRLIYPILITYPSWDKISKAKSLPEQNPPGQNPPRKKILQVHWFVQPSVKAEFLESQKPFAAS